MEVPASPSSDIQFLEAYDRYADAIFRFCYLRVGDRDRARDLTQETFTRTWTYLAEGKSVLHLRAFLYRIARNCMIDVSRRTHELSLDALEEEEGFVPSATGAVDTDVETRLLIAHLQELAPEDRELLVLRYVEGYEPNEIAAMLGISANAAAVRCFRAKRRARALFRP